ncbi:hypothetical protein TspCOW1_15290 [Thiohalobacter sp. COW1]|uniref:Putative heme iron utilization protein n=1 Tax=Thiohalobacter thiocyanaticus TaxID=585455 RepID=A0A1Z4VQ38_9GAMM|nr:MULTISPECIES: DUF2470 domain-containing protein [Thiohalobacter]BAZ93532.1 putative heme iron utilization protein [Thiohalobacter thiocyanaticus]BCO31426.1 hypothetical protein TspCOW1_15290 [Thiohalobacter sp. COW1]
MSQTQTDTDFLAAEEKARMIEHMNEDHADAVLNYVHAFLGVQAATAARLLDIDRDAMSVEYHTDQGRVLGRIPFTEPLTGKAQIRPVLVEMAKVARQRLGLAVPAPH